MSALAQINIAVEREINGFIGKIQLGVTFFKEAGEELVSMKRKNPNIFDIILQLDHPAWLTREVLQVFEAIGSNRLAVEAMFLPKHLTSKLLDMPAEAQSEIATKPVQVFNPDRQKFTFKKARNLTVREIEIAIGKNGIRTPEEQIEIAKNQPTPERVLGIYEMSFQEGKLAVRLVPFAKSTPFKVKLSEGKALIQVLE